MKVVPDLDDKYEQEEVSRLNALPWMLALLGLNPQYPFWGPGDDYMKRVGANGDGWDAGIEVSSWSRFDLTLDELNEIVHFYFAVERDSRRCDACDASGYNPKTKRLADDFYDYSSATGKGWHDQITQDEVQALLDAHRLWDFTRHVEPEKGWVTNDPPTIPTAEAVNAWERRRGLGHDAINRCVLIEARAKRLGFWGRCPECDGHGEVFTASAAHVELTLWLIHPRKGASRGVVIRSVEERDLPTVFAFLKGAADRNAERFAPVVAKAAAVPPLRADMEERDRG